MIEALKKQVGKFVTLDNITENECSLECDALFENGKSFSIFLSKQENGLWVFTDKKATLKFMKEYYEISSPDVKNCISRVLKIYDFTMKSGEIVCKISEEAQLSYKFFQFVMCIGQLVNMYAFFDEPTA
ncbi:MAG: DUF1828 domain-containing protein [Clostridia bacterium]